MGLNLLSNVSVSASFSNTWKHDKSKEDTALDYKGKGQWLLAVMGTRHLTKVLISTGKQHLDGLVESERAAVKALCIETHCHCFMATLKDSQVFRKTRHIVLLQRDTCFDSCDSCFTSKYLLFNISTH